MKFQSTLPVRGATEWVQGHFFQIWISIHAPREGSDLCIIRNSTYIKAISIHAPREGSDCKAVSAYGGCGMNFNPRSP